VNSFVAHEFHPSPLNLYEALRFPQDGRPWQTQWTKRRVSLSVCLSVRSFVS